MMAKPKTPGASCAKTASTPVSELASTPLGQRGQTLFELRESCQPAGNRLLPLRLSQHGIPAQRRVLQSSLGSSALGSAPAFDSGSSWAIEAALHSTGGYGMMHLSVFASSLARRTLRKEQ